MNEQETSEKETGKKLEIIIPVRNRPTSIFRILNTLDRETRGREDVLVTIVDDASTDETPTVVGAFVDDRKDGRFKLIRLTKSGCIGGARNAALRQSKSQYITCFDSDDDMAPGLISDIVQAIDATTPDCVVWGFESIYDKVKTRWMPKLDETPLPEIPVGVWFKAIRRDLYSSFQEGVFCEDCVWWFLQADRLNPEKVAVLDKVGYYYDRRDESFSSAIVYLKKNPMTLETLAMEDTLIKKGMNDRCPSDVLRCLADMYDLRKVLTRKSVKVAWAKRFSDMYKNIMTGRWAY